MRIENAPEEYVSGKINFVLEKEFYDSLNDDVEFDLKVNISDKNKLMTIQKRVEEKKSEDRDISEQTAVIQEIINRSYPDKSQEWRAGVVMKYSSYLLLELYFMWGWRSKKQMIEADTARKEIAKKMLEMAMPQKEV